MTGIFINVPSNVALINRVHLGTLEYVDNAPYLFKGPRKVLLEVRHGNGKYIVNTNRNSVGIKLSLVRLAGGVGCTSHLSDVKRVAGGQKMALS